MLLWRDISRKIVSMDDICKKHCSCVILRDAPVHFECDSSIIVPHLKFQYLTNNEVSNMITKLTLSFAELTACWHFCRCLWELLNLFLQPCGVCIDLNLLNNQCFVDIRLKYQIMQREMSKCARKFDKAYILCLSKGCNVTGALCGVR